jgi:hypothetical protein
MFTHAPGAILPRPGPESESDPRRDLRLGGERRRCRCGRRPVDVLQHPQLGDVCADCWREARAGGRSAAAPFAEMHAHGGR